MNEKITIALFFVIAINWFLFGFIIGKSKGASKKHHDVAGVIDIYQEDENSPYHIGVTSDIDFSKIPTGTRMIFTMGKAHVVDDTRD